MDVAGIATYEILMIKYTVFHIFPVIKHLFNVSLSGKIIVE